MRIYPEPTADELEYARKRYDKIIEMTKKGLTPGMIASSLRLPVNAVNKIAGDYLAGGKKDTAKDTATGDGHADPRSVNATTPADGTSKTTAATIAGTVKEVEQKQAGQPVPPVSPVPEVPPPGQIGKQPPPNIPGTDWSPSSNYSPATGEEKPVPAKLFGAPTISPGEATGSFLEGPFEIHDPYHLAYVIMTEFGIKDAAARGFARRFRHFEPDRYDVLEQILGEGGVNPQARKSIVNTFKVEMELPSPETPKEKKGDHEAQSADAVLRRLKRNVGLAGTTDDPDLDELLKLERESRQLELERIRIAMETEKEKLRQLRGEQGTGDDAKVKIMIDTGYGPHLEEVRKSEVQYYSQFIVKPDGKKDDRIDRIEQLITQMQQDRQKEREDAERRRLEDENRELRARLDAPRGSPEIDAIKEQNRAMAEEMKLMRQELFNRQLEEERRGRQNAESRMDKLESQLQYMTSWDYQVKAKQEAEKRARELGFVPPSEAARIDREQIELEDEQNIVKRKDEAAGRALNVVANKVEQSGTIKKVGEKILSDDRVAQKLINVIDRVGGEAVAGQPPGQPVGPTAAELEAKARMLEQQAAEGGRVAETR